MRKEKLSPTAYARKVKLSSEYIKNRYATDETYRALRATRSLLSVVFRKHLSGHTPKSRRLESITGISTAELMTKLVATMPAVSLDTYGSNFEIDHIIPVAEFQKSSSQREALEACFHPNNLRLIEKSKNRPGRTVRNRTRVRFSDNV